MRWIGPPPGCAASRPRRFGDRSAHAALDQDAGTGATIDRPLQEGNEDRLGQEEGETQQGQLGLQHKPCSR